MIQHSEKIAFVFGAGAVENAWKPIIKILEKPFPNISDADSANCFLARFIYLMRFHASGTSPNSEEALKGMNEDFTEMKKGICLALIDAEKNKIIKPREELGGILHKFIFSNSSNGCVFISTNWDNVVDNYINKIGECDYPIGGSDIIVHHIHGSIVSPNDLYFPSEVVRESYRSKKQDFEMGNLHGTIWKILEDCNKTILYGLSLDPLDAELSQTLAAGWSSENLKEIIVINPDHKKISKRVKLLLDPRFPAKVTGYHPQDLNRTFNY
ncbi:MAG: hypothetical protein HXX18_01895 [Bacteroidetes bacterium]|nr:hypothetical protein [Bacteroidota bacterium]